MPRQIARPSTSPLVDLFESEISDGGEGEGALIDDGATTDDSKRHLSVTQFSRGISDERRDENYNTDNVNQNHNVMYMKKSDDHEQDMGVKQSNKSIQRKKDITVPTTAIITNMAVKMTAVPMVTIVMRTAMTKTTDTMPETTIAVTW